ncbi:MAG: hypothetical protein H6675_02220 [Dehalococcoidia bacterium]|nr:hypothetical protein [Dehalococcoidia bacterium]
MPARATSAPTGKFFVWNGWLKNTACTRPMPSETITSVDFIRPPRPIGMSRDFSTVPRTVASMPGRSAEIGTACEKST